MPFQLGLAVTTIGQRSLAPLLSSAAASTVRPAAVAIANQSGHPLDVNPHEHPFPVHVVPSSGGISAGRNDAVQVLPPDVQVVGFPNDDCSFPPSSLEAVVGSFAAAPGTDAVACTLADPSGPRFALPPVGEHLTRTSVWRAIEPATFLRVDAFRRLDGFRVDLGTGAPSPWQSGEGTDLLLRLLAAGGTVTSRPDITVMGAGERRSLSADEFVAKHRRYARGTGYLYRLHRYPAHLRLRVLVAPLVRATRHDASLSLSLRLARARFLGRLEGLLERPFGDH